MNDSHGELPTRAFGWEDMFVAPDDDPRTDASPANDERSMLVTYLADRRLTFELKCAGLDAHGMTARSVPPSNLSLAGLVRHLAGVERYWFRRVMAGEVMTRPYTDEEEFDGVTADPAGIAAAWADWRAEVAFAEQFVEHAPHLGIIGLGNTPLREVLVHLIEEYARHNGHADLLRECIDGRVGQ